MNATLETQTAQPGSVERMVRPLYRNEIMTAEWLQAMAHAFPNHFEYRDVGMTAYGDAAQCKSIMRHYIRPNNDRDQRCNRTIKVSYRRRPWLTQNPTARRNQNYERNE